jgi:hypothetical protein
VRRRRAVRNMEQEGIALFAVLAFMLLIAAVITPFSVSAHVESLVTRNAIRETRDRFAMQGIAELAAVAYLQRARELRDRPNIAPPKTVACFSDRNDTSITLGFVNHRGLIDLNAAPLDLLRIGFQALGIDGPNARRFAGQANAYRSAPQAEADRRRRFKHAPFESVFELGDLRVGERAISGPLLLDGAPAVFTVHSRAGTLDVAAAPPALAAAIRRFGLTGDESIVENAGAPPALTVVARVMRSGRPVFEGRAVYAVDEGEESAKLRAIEPLRLRNEVADDASSPASPERMIGCDALLSAEERVAMFGVLE